MQKPCDRLTRSQTVSCVRRWRLWGASWRRWHFRVTFRLPNMGLSEEEAGGDLGRGAGCVLDEGN